MNQRHLLSLKDYSREEIEEIFDLAAQVKADPQAYGGVLQGKSLAMIFQKPSTRTRVSFEVGMFQLGGQALYLGADAIQLSRGSRWPTPRACCRATCTASWRGSSPTRTSSTWPSTGRCR